MSEYLIIRLTDEVDEATWIVLDEAGHRLSQTARGPLAGARVAAEGRRVILLVPGLDVITTRVTLPVKSQARLQQMLPFSLEETVAQDVEGLLFAAGPRQPSGQTAVSVVGRDRLDGWLEHLRGAGLSPYAVYADSDGVPDTPAALTLMIEGNRIYGRQPNHAPFVLEGLSLAEVLEMLSTQSDADSDRHHVLVYLGEAEHARREAELAALRAEVSSLDLQLTPEGPLERLGATLIHQPGTNLLQGSYAPKTNWAALGRPWRLTGSLLVGLLVATLLTDAVTFLQLRREDQALTQLVEASCQRNFQQSRLPTCQAEVQRRLAASGSAGPQGTQRFLVTLSAVAEAAGSDSRIEALSFRNGVMDLRVLADSVATLDDLERSMVQTGRFEVRIQSANPVDDGVEGRLQIVGAQ